MTEAVECEVFRIGTKDEGVRLLLAPRGTKERVDRGECVCDLGSGAEMVCPVHKDGYFVAHVKDRVAGVYQGLGDKEASDGD